MDIPQLRNFICIVDAGSMSAAATQLFVSQPLLSQQVAALEASLKTPLLSRTSRGVTPTAAGMALYRESLPLVRHFDAIPGEVLLGANNIQGTVSIGLPSTVATLLAPRLFEAVQRDYPGIQLRLFESISGYLQELLQRGQLDLAVTFEDGMRVPDIPLYTERLYLFGDVPGHELGDRVTVQDMLPLPLILPAQGSSLRRLVDRMFAEADGRPVLLAEVDALPSLLRIVESNRAFTIVPRSTVVARLAQGEVTVREIDNPLMKRTAVLRRLNDRFPPRSPVQAVIATLKTEIQAKEGAGVWDEVLIDFPSMP